MISNEQLYLLAKKVLNNSYSPYSKFSVGAVVLTKDGKVFSGTNVENASYSLCCCAERTALFNAYSEGYRKTDLLKILIIGKTKEPISPCGACRQVIVELMPANAIVIMCNLENVQKEVYVSDLLPFVFNSESLNV